MAPWTELEKLRVGLWLLVGEADKLIVGVVLSEELGVGDAVWVRERERVSG